MANNPYSPPTAGVAEQRETPVAPGPMPRNVKIALAGLVGLQLYALYIVDLGSVLERVDRGTSVVLLWVTVIPHVLQITFIVFTLLRKNWARIALLVFFGWTLISVGLAEYTVRTLPQSVSINRNVLAQLFFVSMLAIRGGAIGLLFTPSATAWFRPRAAR
jgi:hypothetical protein